MTETRKTLQDICTASELLQEVEEPLRLVRQHVDGDLEDTAIELYRQFFGLMGRLLDLEIELRKARPKC